MKKIISIIILLLVIGAGVAAYFYNSFYGINVELNNKENVTVYIPTNAKFPQVVDTLSPYLNNPSSFKQLAEIKKYTSNIKAGKYIIKNSISNNDLINLLRSGSQAEIKLVFNNADSVEELAGKIAKQIEVDSTSLVNYIYDDEFLKKNKYSKQTISSLFIPNTYFFYWNTDAKSFVDRMLKEHKKFWTNERLAKAEKLGMTAKEVAVLASIVQKETVKRDERKIVAGLYINRLKNNWKLGSDPTVIFALKKQSDFKIVIKRVLYKDLEIDSPYNTYKYSGLPPGPITIPEIDALDAVLNYKKNSYFFMCASPDNFGYHNFAKSLRQHNINARKYQNWLNKQNIKR